MIGKSLPAILAGMAFCVFSATFLSGCLENPPDPSIAPTRETKGPPDGSRAQEGYIEWNGESRKIHYEIVNGMAVTGGDILFDLAQITKSPKPAGLAKAATGMITESSFWPSRTIAYVISLPAGDTRRDGINAAIADYNLYTNLVFVPRTSQSSYINFVNAWQKFSSSKMGYPGAGLVRDIQVANDGQYIKGAMLHEMGHAIGLWHEVQRPDRDTYLDMYIPNNPRGLPDYHCENAYKNADGSIRNAGQPNKLSVYDPSNCSSSATNFEIQPGTTAGPVDIKSIMMYVPVAAGLQDANGNLLDNPLTNLGYATIMKRGADPKVFANYWSYNQTLSDKDISDIRSMYPTTPTKIGWLNRGNSCTGGGAWFVMDDENSGNITSASMKMGNTTQVWSPYTGTTGMFKTPAAATQINICIEPRKRMPVLENEYIVFRFTPDCPLGGYPFSRTSDNEDDNNSNKNFNIAPLSQTAGPSHGETIMQFCYVPGDGNTGNRTVVPWSTPALRGAFVNPSKRYPGCNEFHRHYQDDEDISNGNKLYFPPVTMPYQNNILAMIGGGSDTQYFWNSCP